MLSNFFARVGLRASNPKWVAVLDSSVLVGAAFAKRSNTIDALVVGAAISQIFDCVLSEYIQDEVRDVLQRPGIGASHSLAAVEAKFGALWTVARILNPVPFGSPKLVGVVGNDVEDIPVLATGLAIYSVPELAERPRKFLVSKNTRHFTPGQKPFGIEFQTPQTFWGELTRAGRR